MKKPAMIYTERGGNKVLGILIHLDNGRVYLTNSVLVCDDELSAVLSTEELYGYEKNRLPKQIGSLIENDKVTSHNIYAASAEVINAKEDIVIVRITHHLISSFSFS